LTRFHKIGIFQSGMPGVGMKIFLRFQQFKISVSDETEPTGLWGGVRTFRVGNKNHTIKGKEAFGL
jgi:hypothetical protein